MNIHSDYSLRWRTTRVIMVTRALAAYSGQTFPNLSFQVVTMARRSFLR